MGTPDRSSGPVSNVSAASVVAAPHLTAPALPDVSGGPALAPIRADERIFQLDAIRGFALLGILLMNITGFGLPNAAYANPIPAGGATGWNLFM